MRSCIIVQLRRTDWNWQPAEDTRGASGFSDPPFWCRTIQKTSQNHQFGANAIKEAALETLRNLDWNPTSATGSYSLSGDNQIAFRSVTPAKRGLALFDMMNFLKLSFPQMFLTTVLKRFGGGSWHLVTFNINLWSIKKSYSGFSRLPGVTHSNVFVRECSRFSEVIIPHVSL